MYKVLITGARKEFATPALYDVLEAKIEELVEDFARDKLLIIQGGASGIDRRAENVAHRNGIHSARIPALWKSYNKGAGNKRNWIMSQLVPHHTMAFHPDLEESKGTKNMVLTAVKEDLPWAYFNEDGWVQGFDYRVLL